MLINKDIDIVSICVHSDQCTQVAKDIIINYPFVKYIFCEKPVSSSSMKLIFN